MRYINIHFSLLTTLSFHKELYKLMIFLTLTDIAILVISLLNEYTIMTNHKLLNKTYPQIRKNQRRSEAIINQVTAVDAQFFHAEFAAFLHGVEFNRFVYGGHIHLSRNLRHCCIRMASQLSLAVPISRG